MADALRLVYEHTLLMVWNLETASTGIDNIRLVNQAESTAFYNTALTNNAAHRTGNNGQYNNILTTMQWHRRDGRLSQNFQESHFIAERLW